MSTQNKQPPSAQQSKQYANSNLNNVFSKPTPSGPSAGPSVNRFSGMLVLKQASRFGS